MKLNSKSFLIALFAAQLLSGIVSFVYMQPVHAQTDYLDLFQQDVSDANQTSMSPFFLDQAEDGLEGQDGTDGQAGTSAIDDSNDFTGFDTNGQNGINAKGQDGTNANGQNSPNGLDGTNANSQNSPNGLDGTNANGQNNGQNGQNGADGTNNLDFDGAYYP